jgi:hypothetical protein
MCSITELSLAPQRMVFKVFDWFCAILFQICRTRVKTNKWMELQFHHSKRIYQTRHDWNDKGCKTPQLIPIPGKLNPIPSWPAFSFYITCLRNTLAESTSVGTPISGFSRGLEIGRQRKITCYKALKLITFTVYKLRMMVLT